MNKPFVSIIVPVYNVENYLQKCLESIVNQTYKSIEIVLVDDGSKDASGKICDVYASSDSRIMVIHKHNEGVAQARIDGFNNSTGKLVTFIDADDYIDLQYIEKLVAPFEQFDIDLSTCENKLVYPKQDNRISYPKRSTHGYYDRKSIDKLLETHYLWDKNLHRSGLPVYLVTKMIKRKYVLEALTYAKGLWWGEDQVASFHILTNINAMYVISEPLYYYVRHEGQVTKIYKSSLWNNQFESWRRYIELDSNKLLKTQLPQRIWWTIKQNFKKMTLANVPYNEFKNDMQMIEKESIWKNLLKYNYLAEGKREKLAFTCLKHKLYYPFYKILLHRL